MKKCTNQQRDESSRVLRGGLSRLPGLGASEITEVVKPAAKELWMRLSPLVSVVVINHNKKDILRRCLRSVLSLEWPNLEIIVVDNASTDNTRQLTFDIQRKIKVRYLYENKRGIPYARNCGVQSASGDLIVFIDDDAIADENWLKNIEIPFIRDPNIGAVGGLVRPHSIGNSKIERFYMENMLLV